MVARLIRSLVCAIAVSMVASAAFTPRSAWAADALTQAMWRGDVDTALGIVRERISANDGDLDAHIQYIDLLSSVGFARAVAEEYRARALAAPESAEAWALLGRAEPDATASLDAFQRALKLNPNLAPAWVGKAGVQRALGRAVGAVESYEAAVALDPTQAEAWTGLAQAWLALGDGGSALAAARKGLEAAADDPSVWLLVATLAADEALTVLDSASQRHPEISQIWAALGRARFDAQQFESASEAYSRALALAPQDAAAIRVERALADEIRSGALDMTGAAVILDIREVASRDLTLALAALGALAEEQPQSGQVRLVYGNLLRAIGNHGEAEKQLKAARDLMPDDADAWSALGSFYLDRHRAAEARPLLEQAARNRPNDAVLAVAAAVAAGEAGDAKASEAGLRAAIQAFPNSVGPALGLARLLATAGRGDEALDVLTDALRAQRQVDLVLALASLAGELGRSAEVVPRLQALADETGDPRLKAAAEGIRKSSPPSPKGSLGPTEGRP